jgi:cell division transport system permease protein
MRFLRMIRRMFFEAGIGIWRSGWLNVVIVGILTSTLLVFGLMLELSVSLKKLASNFLGSQTRFSVYISASADPAQLADELRGFQVVREVEVTHRDQAWQRISETLDLELDASLNNLPHTLNVRVRQPEDAVTALQKLSRTYGAKVEDVEYAPTLVRKLNALKHMLAVAGLSITLLLAIATFVINFNTIELVIRSRMEELRLLRLMGIPNWFIRGPFLLQGMSYGIFSAILAGLLLTLVDNLVRSHWHQIMQGQLGILDLIWVDAFELAQVLLVLLLAGALCGGVSSYWATSRRMHI